MSEGFFLSFFELFLNRSASSSSLSVLVFESQRENEKAWIVVVCFGESERNTRERKKGSRSMKTKKKGKKKVCLCSEKKENASTLFWSAFYSLSLSLFNLFALAARSLTAPSAHHGRRTGRVFGGKGVCERERKKRSG